MRVNLDNYEAFLLDHLEGNLGKEDREELMAFLALHPEIEVPEELPDLLPPGKEMLNQSFKSGLKKDPAQDKILHYLEGLMNDEEKSRFESDLQSDPVLKAELLAFKKTILSSGEAEMFPGKTGLRRTEDDLVLSDRSILYQEGLLKRPDKKEYELELLVNEKLAADLRLTAATKLVPDPRVVFPDKHHLKKGARIIPLFSYRSVSAVAAGLTLIAALGIIFYQFRTDAPVLTAGKASVDPARPARVIGVPSDAAQAQHSPVATAERKKSSRKLIKPAETADHTVAENLAGNTDRKTDTVSENGFRDSSALASAEPPSNLIKKDSLSAPSSMMLAVSDDDFEDMQKSAGKKRWWQRVADLAGQANKAGIKTIDGESHDENKFRFSFSAFSVEKK